jgi:hypothetical protein
MRKFWMAVGVAAMVSAMGIGVASASASNFEASGGTGATKGVGVIKQEEFKVWPMTVTCNKAVTKGNVELGKPETFEDEAKFSLCSTFNNGVKVIVSPEHVTYNADGVVTLTQAITISPTSLKCKYVIEPQASLAGALVFGDEAYFGNKKFPNGQDRLNLYTVMGGLKYTAVGWPCTGPKENTELKEAKETEETGEEGKLTGGVRDENTGGNLTWVK